MEGELSMATSIWFTGAEVAAHRRFLLAEGANGLALNLSAFFQQRQALNMRDVYDGLDMVLYSSEGGLDPMRVNAFIEANGDRFEMIYGLKCDHPNYVPEWSGNDVNDFYALCDERLAAGQPRVGVSESVAIDASSMRFITGFAARSGVQLVTNSSKAAALKTSWTHVICAGWVAATKYRELQVWDGDHVARYGKAAKAAAIDRHWRQIEAIGVDPRDLVDDDPAAHATLAVRSWLLFSKREAKVVAITSVKEAMDSESFSNDGVAIAGVPVRDETVERERVLLPILSATMLPAMAEGGVAVAGPTAMAARPMRACANCSLSRHCPSYDVTASCAFEIPVEIRTKADLQNAGASLLEMQMQRVFMARFAEDVTGQGLDPMVGAEAERFLRMVVQMRQAQENSETLTITAKTESGVLSRLFGEKVGAANTALAAPINPNVLIEQVFDADVIDPEGDSN